MIKYILKRLLLIIPVILFRRSFITQCSDRRIAGSQRHD